LTIYRTQSREATKMALAEKKEEESEAKNSGFFTK
jgi:hypothetical protein